MAKGDGAGIKGRLQRWREDFPIQWLDDQYIARREFAKALTIGSALLVGVNAVIAAVGRWVRRPGQMGAEVPVGKASEIPTGGSVLFRYPTDEDPCILVRTQSGDLRAYSQVCTHLSCAVVHQSERDNLFCPCHRGNFSVNDGRPTAGPPVRRLPRIWIEQRGDELWAVGRDS
jgi:nitrite reductase/ring-hydroxylating ferredoxin subunit